MIRKISEVVTYEYYDKKELQKDIKDAEKAGRKVNTYEVNGILRADFTVKYYANSETAIYNHKTKELRKPDGTIIYKFDKIAPEPRNNSPFNIDGVDYIIVT